MNQTERSPPNQDKFFRQYRARAAAEGVSLIAAGANNATTPREEFFQNTDVSKSPKEYCL